MTSTITRDFRQSQLALRAEVLRALVDVWPSFDPRNIDESWRAIEPVVMGLIRNGRRASESMAADYYANSRRAQGITAPAPVILLDESWRERAQVAMRVTGPVSAKKATLLRRPDVAQRTLVRLGGSVSRQVMDAGREYVYESVFSEDEAEIGRRAGWRRVTGGDPCDFCLMLAGRGAVYSRETAGFQAHDHCACVPEPDFSVELSERDLIRRAASMDRIERSGTQTRVQRGGVRWV